MDSEIYPGKYFWSRGVPKKEVEAQLIAEMCAIYPYYEDHHPPFTSYEEGNVYFKRAFEILSQVLPEYKPGIVFWYMYFDENKKFKLLRVYGLNEDILTKFKLIFETS